MEPTLQADGSYTISCGGQVDGDGSPRCYGPNDSGLDFTANAGHPGNWWGVKTDGNGNPIIDQGTGMYISDTSLHADGRPINAETVPFIVVPASWARSVPGIVLGCKALVTNIQSGKSVDAVVADIGPAFGEMSIAAHIALRDLGQGILQDLGALKALVRHGGISQYIFRYSIWPGVAAPGFQLQRL